LMEGSGARGEGGKVMMTGSEWVVAYLVGGMTQGMKTTRRIDERRPVNAFGGEAHLLATESRKAT
jgi:hypothetical protein